MEENQRKLTERDGYNLFCRAINERDEEAWAQIIACYRPLLSAWAQRYGAHAQISEFCNEIADQAIVRAWMALTPARLSGFPALAALLAYLRTCVMTVVIDCVRAQAVYERIGDKLDTTTIATPEQIVLEASDRAELWQIVSALTGDERERTILVESLVGGLPPRAILARHPDRFNDIASVYRTKRNLLDRLQRSPELQRLRQDLVLV